MNRRKFLYAASVGAASVTFPAPAISQSTRELKMVTSWPKGLPGLQGSAERIAQEITTLTGTRLQVKVFAAGEMVKPFEVFDAVSSGVADMYHSAEYYWEKQSPGFNFFAAVPFGFTADEMAAWIHFGGGQALWDELSAKFNIKPLLSTNTGVQMGGWFTKEVKGPESYSGLKYRMVSVLNERGMAIPMGAADYVTKPVDRQRLAEILREHCADIRSASILVVEDETATRELLCHSLTGMSRTPSSKCSRAALTVPTMHRISGAAPLWILMFCWGGI